MSFLNSLFSSSSSQAIPKIPATPENLSPTSLDSTISIRTMSDDLAELEGKPDMGQQPSKPAQEKPQSPFLESTDAPQEEPIQMKEEGRHSEKPRKSPSLRQIAASLAMKNAAHPKTEETAPIKPEEYAYEENMSLQKDSEESQEVHQIPDEETAGEDLNGHLADLPAGLAATAQPEIVYAPKKSHPVLIGLFVSVTLLFVGGGFYWWKFHPTIPSLSLSGLIPTTDTAPQPTDQPQPTPPEKDPEPAADKEQPSVTVPATIAFTEASPTPGQVRASILEQGKSLPAIGSSTPTKLIIADKDSSPVSFATFCQWMGISLSQNVISAFEDSFSLFLHGDSGNVRIGLVLTPKDPTRIAPLLSAIEPRLLQTLSPLFLELPSGTAVQTSKFNTSEYAGVTIRYTNIPTPTASFPGSLSVDYALLNSYVVIGTSKQTGRALIDMLNSENTSSMEPEKHQDKAIKK